MRKLGYVAALALIAAPAGVYAGTSTLPPGFYGYHSTVNLYWSTKDTVATSSPGMPFSLDYGRYLEWSPPYNLISTVTFQFGCIYDYSTLCIVLDSGPTVYTYAPLDFGHARTYIEYYEPSLNQGSSYDYELTNAPVLPEGWKAELADGVFSGRLWLEGTSHPNTSASLLVASEFVFPEPASLGMLGIGVMGLLRRRR